MGGLGHDEMQHRHAPGTGRGIFVTTDVSQHDRVGRQGRTVQVVRNLLVGNAAQEGVEAARRGQDFRLFMGFGKPDLLPGYMQVMLGGGDIFMRQVEEQRAWPGSAYAGARRRAARGLLLVTAAAGRQ